ncbi:Uncharacterised protein [Shigella sonnei]|nr:Uncharacterised protein [Shigella sonnei]CSN00736.1 Uncharacterised protein [Shigella sonnei]CTC69502.1 Uncharacterised protein [Shigella sonnei]
MYFLPEWTGKHCPQAIKTPGRLPAVWGQYAIFPVSISVRKIPIVTSWLQPSARIHSPKAAAGISLSPCLSCPCSSQEDTLSLNCHRQTIQNFMVLFLLLTASWSVTWWEPGRKSGRPGKYSSPLTARLNTAGHVMNRPRLTGLTAEVPCHWKP